MISSEKYAELSRSICPYCESENITGETPQVEGSSAWARVYCNDCDMFWDDVYKLTGYDLLEDIIPQSPPQSHPLQDDGETPL